MMNGLAVPISNRDHIQGDPSALVRLLEYGDFECPYCELAYGYVKEVQKEMDTDLVFVFRHFPLTDIHPHALQASLASEAAGIQGKFWEMHDLLFTNQDHLKEEDLIRYAKQLDLNIDQFKKDMESEKVLKHIKEDIESGEKSEVMGTPTFFINDIKYEGPYGSDTLLSVLEEAAK